MPGAPAPGFRPVIRASLNQRPERAEDSPYLDLFRRVADLDFALRAGFTVTLAEINTVEFTALRILHDERDKHKPIEEPKTKWCSAD